MWVFYNLTDNSISLWLFPRPGGQQLIGQFFKLKIATKPISADFVRLGRWIGRAFLDLLKAKSE